MQIVEFEWDDANVRHLARHGIDVEDHDAMLRARITTIRNKRAGSGLYKFIGRGRGGTLVTVVVAPTAVAGCWRPITGRRSNDGEKRTYER